MNHYITRIINVLFISAFYCTTLVQARIITEETTDYDEVSNMIRHVENLTISQAILDEVAPIFRSYLFINAVEKGRYEEAREHLNNGVDVDKHGENGRTALMIACADRKRGFVELLFEKGANVNARDEKGITALMEAIRFGHQDIAQILTNHLNNKTSPE